MKNESHELLDHPCKDRCSGWQQGYERGIQEGRSQMRVMRDPDETRDICAVHFERGRRSVLDKFPTKEEFDDAYLSYPTSEESYEFIRSRIEEKA